MRTPFLISVQYPCFEDYILALSPDRRTEIRRALKKNEDLDFELIPYDKSLVSSFMSLWEKQTVYGNSGLIWSFGIGFVEYLWQKGKMLFFAARSKLTGKVVSIMFAEIHGRLVEGHPPLYDKNITLNRQLAKFIAASFFKYLIESRDFDWVDLNGGYGRSWKDVVSDYHNGLSNNYKWMYVPSDIKKGLSNEKPFRIFIDLFTFTKTMVEEENYKFSYLESLKLGLIRYLYWWKGERVMRLRSKIKKAIRSNS